MSPIRILIIDDDRAVVRMLQRIVTEYGLGAVVETASDGLSGEALALRLRPDLVLIDLLMPGQDGLETIRRLRTQGFTVSFVMISQVTEKDLVARAYKAGVEYFIHKPLNLTEILSVLRKVIEGLKMREMLAQIRASLGPAAGMALAPAAAPLVAPPVSGAQLRRAGRRVLADLGILGDAGGADLVAMATLPSFQDRNIDLSTLYAALSDSYQSIGEGKAPGVKAIEQRLRRAAQAALTHLAAHGLEDFADPRFERLAPIFFEFNEVRVEMNRLRAGGGAPGRISLRKFVDAFRHEMESALDDTEDGPL